MIARILYILSGKRFRGGPRARARAFWHYVVRSYPYEICGDCGRPVGVVWLAPDTLWLTVNGAENGVMCVPCFDQRATDMGFSLTWGVEHSSFPVRRT